MKPPVDPLSVRQMTAIMIVSLLAGFGDFFSGLLLVLAPDQALRLMGVPPAQEPTLIQFIGVFVACVGASYLLGLVVWKRTGSCSLLKAVWQLTILFRIAAGCFVTTQIATGHFSFAWASVPATDFTWATVQAILLCLGFFDSAA